MLDILPNRATTIVDTRERGWTDKAINKFRS